MKIEASGTVSPNINSALAPVFTQGQIGTMTLMFDDEVVDTDSSSTQGRYLTTPLFFEVKIGNEVLATAHHGIIELTDGGSKNDSFKFSTSSGKRFLIEKNLTLTGPDKNNLPLITGNLSLNKSNHNTLDDELPSNSIGKASDYKLAHFGLEYCTDCGDGRGLARGVNFKITKLSITKLPSQRGALVLQEAFSADKPVSFLQHSSGVTPIWRNGEVIFSGNTSFKGMRQFAESFSYLKTDKTDFAAVSFITETTVNVSAKNPYNRAYFGMGSGKPIDHLSVSPDKGPHIFSIITNGNGADNGGMSIINNGTKKVRLEITSGELRFPTQKNERHRLRFMWDAKNRHATFAIHRNYTGGPFRPTGVMETTSPADIGFDYNNSRIFFGGGMGASFDDFSINFAAGISYEQLVKIVTSQHATTTPISTHMRIQSMRQQQLGDFATTPAYRQRVTSRTTYEGEQIYLDPYDDHEFALAPYIESCNHDYLRPRGSTVDRLCLPSSWAKAELQPDAVELDNEEGISPPDDWIDLGYTFELTPNLRMEDGHYIFTFSGLNNSIIIRHNDDPNKRGCYTDSPKAGQYMYKGNKGDDRHVRHTQLNGWNPVWTAGELEIHNGKIIWVSNESGHYEPSMRSLEYLVAVLEQWGLVERNSIHRFEANTQEIPGYLPHDNPQSCIDAKAGVAGANRAPVNVLTR